MTELNIMLVDDEVGFLRTTQKLLERRGYHVETAEDGTEALQKMAGQPFDVVLLDVRMPKMDGVTVLKKIKRDYPEVDVIMLTGHATVENAVEGIQLGASHYLVKPADIDDIVDSIEISHAGRELKKFQTEQRVERLDHFQWPLFIAAAIMPLLFYGVLVFFGMSNLGRICRDQDIGYVPGLLSGFFCPHRWLAFAVLSAGMTVILIAVRLAVREIVRRAKAYAVQREQREFQLLHASKLASIGELAAGIAHEINNPLAIIVAHCGIIRDLIDPEFNPELDLQQVSAGLDTICQASFRAKQVTRQLIDFGLKRNSLPVSCQVEDLLDKAAEEMLGHEEDPGRFTVIRRYDPDLPPVKVDAARMKQAFSHLLNNARDAIEGVGEITLIVRHIGGYMEITIEDNGSGMTAKQMRSCFKPFFSTRSTGLSTGLSLGIALSIVESHGGAIDVQSVPGRGSSFTVLLPLTESAAGVAGKN